MKLKLIVSIPVRDKEPAPKKPNPEKPDEALYQSPYGIRNQKMANISVANSYQSPYGIRNVIGFCAVCALIRVSIPVRDKEQQDFVFLPIIHHTSCFVKPYFLKNSPKSYVNQHRLCDFGFVSLYDFIHLKSPIRIYSCVLYRNSAKSMGQKSLFLSH